MVCPWTQSFCYQIWERVKKEREGGRMVGYTGKWLFVERECMTMDPKRNACVGNRHGGGRGRGGGAQSGKDRR